MFSPMAAIAMKKSWKLCDIIEIIETMESEVFSRIGEGSDEDYSKASEFLSKAILALQNIEED